MTVKAISGIHKFVITSTDDKTAGALLTAPPGSIAYEITGGAGGTAREWMSFGGGVWAMKRGNSETST